MEDAKMLKVLATFQSKVCGLKIEFIGTSPGDTSLRNF